MPLGYTTCIWADGLRHVFVAPCFFSNTRKVVPCCVCVVTAVFFTMISVHVFVALRVFATTRKNIRPLKPRPCCCVRCCFCLTVALSMLPAALLCLCCFLLLVRTMVYDMYLSHRVFFQNTIKVVWNTLLCLCCHCCFLLWYVYMYLLHRAFLLLLLIRIPWYTTCFVAPCFFSRWLLCASDSELRLWSGRKNNY